MTIIRIALVFLLLLAVAIPAAHAGEADDLMKKASNLSLIVPEKGDALLGTKGSMSQMSEWLIQCANSLMGFFTDVMNMLGLGNTDYTKQMNETLTKGLNLSQGHPAR
jgi:hypothetical protein